MQPHVLDKPLSPKHQKKQEASRPCIASLAVLNECEKSFFLPVHKKRNISSPPALRYATEEKKKENTRRVFDHLLPSADREARRRKDEWKAREEKGGGEEESLVGSLGWDGNRPRGETAGWKIGMAEKMCEVASTECQRWCSRRLRTKPCPRARER